MQAIIDRIRFPLIGWFYALNPGRIGSRKVLPFYLNHHRLQGEGAELGVQRGLFSEHLLRYWKGGVLHCIDPWLHFDPTEYAEKKDNVSEQTHETYHAETVARLKKFGARAQIHRATSRQAAAAFADGSLDFVFIDAQHHYDAVKEDIDLWHPKIKTGGLLCGHDWLLDYGPPRYGVRKAVMEFAEQTSRKILVSADKSTWFIPLHKETSAQQV